MQPMKNAGLAALLSFFIPGLGQIYNGQILKAAILFVFGWIIIVPIVGWVLGILIRLYSAYDAHKSATKFNEGLGRGRDGITA